MTALFRRHAAFFVVFIALGFVFFLSIREGNDWGGDFSIYVLETRNFILHQPFDRTSYVPTAESLRNHPAAYPPLTSLFLIPVYRAWGVDYKAFKIELTFFLWLSMPFYYVLGCRLGLPREIAAVVVLLFGLCPLLLTVEQQVSSDTLFLFVSGLALLAIDEIHRRGWSERYPIPAAGVAAVLLVLCYLTRVTGLALIGAFGVYELLRVRRSARFAILSFVLIALALIAYTRFAYRPGAQYGSQFILQPAHIAENALSYLQTPASIWATAPRLVRYVVSFAVLVLTAAGFVRRLFHPGLVEFWLLIWLMVLLGYSVNDKRYILPFLPFLLMYAAEALILVAQKAGAHRTLVLRVCGTAAVLLSVVDLRAVERGPIREGVTQPTFAEVCSFLRSGTPENALLLSWNPRVFALYTDRPSALYPQHAAPAEVEREIPDLRPVFVIYYDRDPDSQNVMSYIDYAGPRARRVFEDADFRVYSVEIGK